MKQNGELRIYGNLRDLKRVIEFIKENSLSLTMNLMHLEFPDKLTEGNLDIYFKVIDKEGILKGDFKSYIKQKLITLHKDIQEAIENNTPEPNFEIINGNELEAFCEKEMLYKYKEIIYNIFKKFVYLHYDFLDMTFDEEPFLFFYENVLTLILCECK